MLDKIFIHNWMALPATTRGRLRELLHIGRTGQTEVSTTGGGQSVLISDGVTAKDLEVITTASLREFIGERAGDEMEFPRLWVMAVQKADMTLSEVVEPAKKEEATVEKPVSTGDNSTVEEKNEKPIQKKSAKK